MNTNILVGRKKVEWIAYNHKISGHAKTQMVRRDICLEFELAERILNSPLAWKTHTGCIAIALDLYNYVVVDIPNEASNDKLATIVTFVNLQLYDENVIDKMLVEYKSRNQTDASYID